MPEIHGKLGMFVLATILSFCPQVCGQITSSTDRELAEVKRKNELLRHPTFVSLRLVSAPRDVPRETPTDTPAPYKVKDYIAFELFMTQNSSDQFTMWIPLGCFQCRPELSKDGEVIPYNRRVQKLIESEQPTDDFRGSGAPITYQTGREYGPDRIDISDWYDPLDPGRYQLTVRRRLVWDGDWVVSNPVYFEVIPRTPGGPIPAGVTIELTPQDVAPRTDGKPYQVGSELFVTFLVRNKSDQPLKINVIDREYSNRPELFKDGKLVPYLEQATALIKSKEENPHLVEENDFFLDPQLGTWPDGLDLKKWYGRLSPGSYRLVIRHRFEIDGPWTAESAPLLFEVVPARKN